MPPRCEVSISVHRGAVTQKCLQTLLLVGSAPALKRTAPNERTASHDSGVPARRALSIGVNVNATTAEIITAPEISDTKLTERTALTSPP